MRMHQVLAVFAVLGVGLASSQARAQHADGDGHFGYGHGYGCGALYNVYVQDQAPYFALHPPVYYSYPVARPYGYSPFAYPPYILTPEVEQVEPRTMHNPFVPRSEELQPVKEEPQKTALQKTSLQKAPPSPLRIVNPFALAEAGDLVDGGGAVRIFPASLVE